LVVAPEVVSAVELFPEVAALVAEPVLVVAPVVAALVAEPFLVVAPVVASAVGLEVSEPEVVSVDAVAAVSAEPEAVFVAVVSADRGVLVVFVAAVIVADVAEHRFSVDIPVPSGVSVPVSVVVAGVDNPGRPRFFVFPSIYYDANSASFVEIVGEESVHNSTGALANCGSCSILSSLGLHHNKSLEQCCNNPSPGHNTVSDTNGHTMDATTSHSRKRDLPLSPEQRKHCPFQAGL